MVSLTLYGGAGEIGGNKILLEDKGVKIYLDFGQSFGFGEDFFYEYLQPRTANGMEVFFEFGLVPKIPKLYAKDQLQLTDLKYQKPDIDAVIISHSHADHVGHLSFLDPSIPIYMGHGTHEITEIYHKLWPGLFNIGDHDFRLFKTGDKIKVKHLIIEPIHVEHSVPGAYGFIIHTSKGALVYTGDFRRHGPRSDMTKDFIEKAAKSKPYALIIEGTRIGHDVDHNFTEKEVEEKAIDIIRSTKGTAFVYFAMTNIDRFMSFYNAAVKNKRVLVIDTRLAYVIDRLKSKISGLPDVYTDKNLRVYYRIAKSCTFCEKDYAPYEREYMKRMITYEEISKNPSKYVMHLGFFRLMELVYIQPKEASFIYSQSEHLLEGEDKEEERRVFENWMKHFNISFHKAHCSGHASRKDLIETAKKINAEMIIPVHTDHQEEWGKEFENVEVFEKGERREV